MSVICVIHPDFPGLYNLQLSHYHTIIMDPTFRCSYVQAEKIFSRWFFSWFLRWGIECRARGVEQASGFQAWKHHGQIMMTINVGNEQQVTSLAGRTILVLKGRESGVGQGATLGCKDNGSRDIKSNEAHVSPKTHKQIPNEWDDPELCTQRTKLATQGLNFITCCRKSCNFSWKLNQTLIKRLHVLLNYPENQCCSCFILVSFFFLIASDLIGCFWLASSSRWDIQQIRGIFIFYFFYQEACEV